MSEQQQIPWYRRWVAGVGRKEYLFALPFCVGVLVAPLLPTFGVVFILRQRHAILALLFLLALALGYPVLRVKRPRAAWWVAIMAALLGSFSLLVVDKLVGRFFGFYTVVAWIVTAVFLVLNWKRLREWTFVAVGVLILLHFALMDVGSATYAVIRLGWIAALVALIFLWRRLRWWAYVAAGVMALLLFVFLDVGPVALALIGMGLMSLYLRLPDRDNFARLPIVVTVLLALLLAHAYNFYFDVGGSSDLRGNPAARRVFEYNGLNRGWARFLGGNPSFLSPSCDGTKFYVGSKVAFRSGLTIIDPATSRTYKIPLSGGPSDNIGLTCEPERLYVGDAGANQLQVYDPAHPQAPLATERMDGVRIGLLRLDALANKLYLTASNTRMLHVLQAMPLADTGLGVETGAPVTDVLVDRAQGHQVILVTMTGELRRYGARGVLLRQAPLNMGLSLFYDLALDGKNRRLFVTSLLGHELLVVNADTFEPAAHTPLFRGGRYMAFDEKRELVYVASFFLGKITAIESQTLKTRWTVKVGRRVRYLTLDHRRDQLCFTSEIGGYCLDLERLSPAPKAPAATPTPTPTPVAPTASPTPSAPAAQ